MPGAGCCGACNKATLERIRCASENDRDGLGPVFQAMLENATRLCEAKSGFLFRAENDDFRKSA
jgi:hypothetical protein